MENNLKRITAVLGPTNTGKTYMAIEKMFEFNSGIFGLPLRLLAREVYDKIVQKIDPKKVGIKFNNPENLKGKDADYNARKIIDIFSGSKNEFSEAVSLNSAAALIVCNKFNKFEEAYEFSKKHLESDKALIHLKKIQTF